jgi:hypothetical protein
MSQQIVGVFSSYQDFFDIVFQRLKTKFDEIYPAEKAEELPPVVLGMKNFVHSLPCPVKVIELRVDTKKYRQIADDICQLVGYNFSKSGDHSVSYCGIADADDTAAFNKFLTEEFGLSPSEELAKGFCCDLATIYFSDTDKPDVHFQFPRYDIRRKPEQFVSDIFRLISEIQLSPETTQKFWPKEVDFNALYGLPEDQVLPFSMVIEKDPILSGFVKLSGDEAKSITIEDLQRRISAVQLIPQVPDAVKRVFRIAKELYIFGYFRYMFFTVSEHYAFLALESAIKNRYVVSLGDKAILKNPKGHQQEIRPPSWERIFDFCLHHRREGWNVHQIEVNGADFPATMSKLLDWLVANKVIPKWERPRYEAGVHLRDSLSHLESPSVLMPSAQTLKTTAEEINRLYANVDKQS